MPPPGWSPVAPKLAHFLLSHYVKSRFSSTNNNKKPQNIIIIVIEGEKAIKSKQICKRDEFNRIKNKKVIAL